MSKNKRLTVLFMCFTFVYILYMTSCSQESSPTTTPASKVTSTSQATTEEATAFPTLPSLEVVRRPAPGGPLSAFTTADFMGPSVCATCHINLRDQTGADVSMPIDWRSTMMANAGIDPIWQAKVSSEVARNPELKAVIEKKCSTCHMPMAETQAMTDRMPVSALGDGFYNAAHPLHMAAIDGVSCTLCHQVSDVNLGTMEGFSGGYVIDTSTNAPWRMIYGPYQNPVARQMQNHTGYTPAYGEHMLSAEHCGTCHNLYTPYVDSEGTIMGEFPEQTPYSEWQYSTFGEENSSCQSCHMPLAEGGVVISQMPGRLTAREPFFKHYFVGGNAFMLQLLADWGADLEVSATQAELNTTRDRVIEQVGSNTANLTLTDLALEDNLLSAELEVEVMTGHKFPTSFPSRRSWLHVVVTDASGQIVFESGKPNPDGTISENDADFDATAYEPHYDLITEAEQVQIYEAIMENSDGEVTYTLLRAAAYAKDNRLLPDGADKAKLPADIAVYGAAAEDPNFIGGSDRIWYQVDVSGFEGPFAFSAELLYETLSYRFIQDLLLDETDLIKRFEEYYDLADKTPLVVDRILPTAIK